MSPKIFPNKAMLTPMICPYDPFETEQPKSIIFDDDVQMSSYEKIFLLTCEKIVLSISQSSIDATVKAYT